MSINDDLSAAQSAVDADNERLAADTAARDAIQAKIDAAAPHLSLWQEVQAEASQVGGELEARLMSIVARGRALLGVQ